MAKWSIEMQGAIMTLLILRAASAEMDTIDGGEGDGATSVESESPDSSSQPQ